MTADSAAVWLWLSIGIGLFGVLAGAGILVVCLRLAATLTRVNATLDVVDAQIAALSAPIAATLSHVDGIAGTADTTVAKLGGVADEIERVAGRLGKTAGLVQDALAPSIVNLGATLVGLTAGLRRLLRGRDARGSDVL